MDIVINYNITHFQQTSKIQLIQFTPHQWEVLCNYLTTSFSNFLSFISI